MRTLRIEVRRTAEKSLITEDRMRVDVELEFYVRVTPSPEGIATAAQALGAKSFTARLACATCSRAASSTRYRLSPPPYDGRPA
jgi:uncharacterized membrane protein YqiK